MLENDIVCLLDFLPPIGLLAKTFTLEVLSNSSLSSLFDGVTGTFNPKEAEWRGREGEKERERDKKIITKN